MLLDVVGGGFETPSHHGRLEDEETLRPYRNNLDNRLTLMDASISFLTFNLAPSVNLHVLI